MLKFSIHEVIKKIMKYMWKISMLQKDNFLGVFRAMWRILIHATYKTGMERIGTRVWQMRSKSVTNSCEFFTRVKITKCKY